MNRSSTSLGLVIAVVAAATFGLSGALAKPLLESGTTVLLDRFVDSSLAYQGGGRELGIDRVLEANLLATRGRLPDATILVRVTPQLAAERLAATGERPDRLEAAGDAFFARVHAAYDELAERFPERIHPVDGAGSIDAIHAAVLAALEPTLSAVGIRLGQLALEDA